MMTISEIYKLRLSRLEQLRYLLKLGAGKKVRPIPQLCPALHRIALRIPRVSMRSGDGGGSLPYLGLYACSTSLS